jgi:hypothetical protein
MATTKQKEADLQRTRELWAQYVNLQRRSLSFQQWVMLKLSCTRLRAARHVEALRAEHGGQFPPEAPPEAS